MFQMNFCGQICSFGAKMGAACPDCLHPQIVIVLLPASFEKDLTLHYGLTNAKAYWCTTQVTDT